jgi:hypothetical protein
MEASLGSLLSKHGTMNTRDVNEEFARLIHALEPWLNQIVIIGGWAYNLYRFDPAAQQLGYPPLMTIDADVAAPIALEHSDQDIHTRLLDYGFKEELFGQDNPPVTQYRLADAQTGFYAEFLTPLIGKEVGRRGQQKVTRRIGGVVSQQLRYLELLLQEPWTVTLDKSKGFPFDHAAQIRIANPVSFIAHKILIQNKRKPADFSKDILYVHDTVQIFGARLSELKEQWNKSLKPQLHSSRIKEIERGIESAFRNVNDTIRDASRMVAIRHLSPEAIRETCYMGLTRLFL